ncbi:MAG: transporter [Verrucomicrobiota bacterium]
MEFTCCKNIIALNLLFITQLPHISLADEPPIDSSSPTPTNPAGTLLQWSPHVSGAARLNQALVTDRPDFTEASVTVGKGITQIEFGYTYIDGGDSELHSLGEALLRYGILTNWLELRLGFLPLIENEQKGFADLYLGFKIALTPQQGLLPEMAIIPQSFAPTGSQNFRSHGWEPGLNWVYSWQINDTLSTAGSSQVNRRFNNEGNDFYELAQSWTVSASLTEKIGAYSEWFALLPLGGSDSQNEHYLNGGFTYLINQNLQADIRVGWGLNEHAQDFFAGAGLSIRFQ